MRVAGGHDGRVRLLGALRSAGRLVLPVECAGCGRWDVALCARCRDLLAATPRRCEQDAPMIAGDGPPVWSVAAYAGPVRSVVLAWKNHRRRDISAALLRAVAAAARAWALDPALRAALGPAADASRTVLVMPAPSGLRRRLAHRFVVGELADAVARGLASGLADHPSAVDRVLVVDALRRRGGGAHQAGRGARSRARNRRGGVVVAALLPPGAVVVVVDDVVTTGATLAACVSALSDAGAHVVAGLALASTPAPARTRRVPGGSVRADMPAAANCD
ncbi:ComF family protein [Georgenia muralis]